MSHTRKHLPTGYTKTMRFLPSSLGYGLSCPNTETANGLLLTIYPVPEWGVRAGVRVFLSVHPITSLLGSGGEAGALQDVGSGHRDVMCVFQPLPLQQAKGHPSEMASSFPSHFQTQKLLFGLNTADHENSFSLQSSLNMKGSKKNSRRLSLFCCFLH